MRVFKTRQPTNDLMPDNRAAESPTYRVYFMNTAPPGTERVIAWLRLVILTKGPANRGYKTRSPNH